MPALFTASGVAGAASLLALAPCDDETAAVLRRYGIAGKVGELAAAAAVEHEVSDVTPYKATALWRVSHLLTTISLLLSLPRRRWSASYEFHYVSRNFTDRYNAIPVGPRSLHDVALGITPWSWSPEWTAECRNLSDQQVEDYAGYPLPGRAFYLGLRARAEWKGTIP